MSKLVGRTLARQLTAPLLGLSLLVVGPSGLPGARAASPSVSVGEVVVAPEGVGSAAAPALTRALRAALTEELAQLAGQGVVVARPLVVSATLTRLSSQRRDRQASATAAISLALRRADDQVLFAELLGRASAEETAGTLASVQSAALRAAVQGAVRRLPEAVKRSR
jgi:hypothetical protein